MARYALNGRFLTRKLTGQERFARELVLELDKIANKDEFVLVTPEYASDIPLYNNISVVKYGKVKSHFWEQVSFYRYIKKNHLISINLTTTCPLLSPDIVCLHDAAFYEIPQLLTRTLYGKLSTAWHKMIFKAAAKKAKMILTVSEYSKQRLMHYLHIPENRISIVYNAWQHFLRVKQDDSIFDEFPKLNSGGYFMALSSLAPQKNFVWIKEVAKRNLKKQFVICGKKEKISNFGEKDLDNANIIFTGYVSDGKVKALMGRCKAFIHPAKYEGFGIPPLEAMSCGAELILSNATCLPELYGSSAHFIDPDNYEIDLDQVLNEKISPARNVLEKFSWAQEAAKLLAVVRNF